MRQELGVLGIPPRSRENPTNLGFDPLGFNAQPVMTPSPDFPDSTCFDLSSKQSLEKACQKLCHGPSVMCQLRVPENGTVPSDLCWGSHATRVFRSQVSLSCSKLLGCCPGSTANPSRTSSAPHLSPPHPDPRSSTEIAVYTNLKWELVWELNLPFIPWLSSLPSNSHKCTISSGHGSDEL